MKMMLKRLLTRTRAGRFWRVAARRRISSRISLGREVNVEWVGDGVVGSGGGGVLGVDPVG